MSFIHNDIATKYSVDAAIAEGGGGSALGLDFIIWYVNSELGWQVEGNFANALEKMANAKAIFGIVYEDSGVGSTSFGTGAAATIQDIIYETTTPNRIVITLSSSAGFYWTADGVEFYD